MNPLLHCGTSHEEELYRMLNSGWDGIVPSNLETSRMSALLQATLARDSMQPSVTSGYTPTSTPQTGYGAPSHSIHNLSGPVTGTSPTFQTSGGVLTELSVSEGHCRRSMPS